jgi:3-methyladenine DNA glycosylase/8-oxoguanine DNA glycosylase
MIRPKHDHAPALEHLASADPRLGRVIAHVGPCLLGDKRVAGEHAAFVALAQAIVSQQLSGKAAETIFGRVAALGENSTFPEPQALLAIPESALRGAGLSGAKAASVRDLASRVHTGQLRLAELETASDDAIIEALTEVRGIGRWTAEMFLMFRLVRPDVLPTGDLGIRKGFQKLFRMRAMPSEERMLKLSRPWRPFRTVASWYLWRLLDAKLPDQDEEAAPKPKARSAKAGAKPRARSSA